MVSRTLWARKSKPIFWAPTRSIFSRGNPSATSGRLMESLDPVSQLFPEVKDGIVLGSVLDLPDLRQLRGSGLDDEVDKIG
jgi:hypothetical protein